MKEIIFDSYDFEYLISRNCLYVDKSEYYWKLISSAAKTYFMSRPRRFGKSLTVSALRAIFSGKRDLFEGLAIDSKDYDWAVYPVIHLNMAQGRINSIETLTEIITYQLDYHAKLYGVSLTNNNISLRFQELITALAGDKNKVVILVDEYDKPILDNIMSENIKQILAEMKGFYGILKTCDSMERFVFMTGVSKFSKVSVFSDLNNLVDLTMDARFANMMGYTQNELEVNFGEYLKPLAEVQKLDYGDFLAKIKLWYDGFRFEKSSETVYNPVSLASFIRNRGDFRNYWFATGTPTFLLEVARASNFNIEQTLTEPVDELVFSAYEVGNLNPLVLMIQTGYLTIKSYEDGITGTDFYLDFPNLEVKSSFQTYFLAFYIDKQAVDTNGFSKKLVKALSMGNPDEFISVFNSLMAGVPYDLHVKVERYYQTIFFVVFRMIGVYIQAEARTFDGRIDAFAAYGDNAYVFEFKLDSTAEIALEQIKTKEYFKQFENSGKKITLIGANFDSETGKITDYKIEPYNS
ncbi:MAG: putative AAA-ATPase [bacterium ADurb.Bin157]|nr:MAG: putative AAA-ATPase [bacterium ADurb.Bin157]